jgi:hypothetical protein
MIPVRRIIILLTVVQGHLFVVPALDAPKVVESLRSHPDEIGIFIQNNKFQYSVFFLPILYLLINSHPSLSR